MARTFLGNGMDARESPFHLVHGYRVGGAAGTVGYPELRTKYSTIIPKVWNMKGYVPNGSHSMYSTRMQAALRLSPA